MKNIMFIAPPAAGKGTQAKKVAESYGIPHISSGDVLREMSQEDSELGHSIAEKLATGKFIEDNILYQLIENRLKREDCKNGYILDGFPRNLSQAIEYDKILNSLGYEVGTVILIHINEETLEKRITGRRTCESCHAIYNIHEENNSPKVESICDNCGGKLYQRTDDNVDSFKNRLKAYKESTEPIIQYYREKNVLHEINGEDTVDNVFKQVKTILDNEN